MTPASINQLINSGANITIQVTPEQLREAFLQWGEALMDAVKPEPQDRYMTSEEVCEMMSICKSTLMKWQRHHWIHPVRQGGVTRYRLSDIEEFNRTRK